MELTRIGLKNLLDKDEIFSDYLNTFLNLPGFYLRVTYIRSNDSYTIDPPIQTDYYVLHPDDITAWIHCCRFPHFLKSSLFYEYKLCVALNEKSTVLQSISSKTLSSVASMYDFKKFLFQTEGESAFYFWLDVERLKLSSQSSIWNRKLVLEIIDTYIMDQSLFKLSTPSRENLIKLYKGSKGKIRIPWNTKQITKELVFCQREALERLCNYWCCRFIQSMAVSELPSWIESSSTEKLGYPVPKGKVVPLPSIVLSRGEGTLPRKLSNLYCHESSPMYVSESKENCLSLAHNVSHATFARTAHAPNIPAEILPRTVENSIQESIITPFLSILDRPINEGPFNLEPFLNASLRADFAAGNHFFRYLKKTQPTLEYANYLLFWQSVELLGIKEEMKSWYSRWSRQQKRCSHTNPECPYIYYYEPHLIARDFVELCRLFLSPDGLHCIRLPRTMQETLEDLVQKGMAQSFALEVQKFVAQQLLIPWLNYMVFDYNNFKNTYLTRKYQRRFPVTLERQEHDSTMDREDKLAEHSYSSEYLQVMWDALKYLEAIKYVGIHQLPSRRPTKTDFRVRSHSPSLSILDEAEKVILEHKLDGAGMLTTIDDKLLWDLTKGRYRRIVTISTKMAEIPVLADVAYLTVPSFITDILSNLRHLEAFKDFVTKNGPEGTGEMLEFWLAVESLKKLVAKPLKYSLKLKEINEKFINGHVTETFKCDAPAIRELDEGEDADPVKLLRAQAAVREVLQKDWFDLYVQYITGQRKKSRTRTPREAVASQWNADRRRAAWTSFIRGLVSFKQGVNNAAAMKAFRQFLSSEIALEKEAQGTSHPKKLLGSKVITVSKLLNDLDFWLEVIRYKTLMTNIQQATTNTPHNPEDFITVHKKALAIVNCYLDSSTSPRVQVNATSDTVREIINKLSVGNITFNFFYKAILDVFSGLMYYWRKFTAERIVKPKGSKQPSSKGKTSSLINIKTAKKLSLKQHGRCSEHTFQAGPIMSFSLCHGLRWMFPGYIIIYIPHSCWELEAVGVELPEETALEHHLRMKRRKTLLVSNRPESTLSFGDTSILSSQDSVSKRRKNSAAKDSSDSVEKELILPQLKHVSYHPHCITSHSQSSPRPMLPSSHGRRRHSEAPAKKIGKFYKEWLKEIDQEDF